MKSLHWSCLATVLSAAALIFSQAAFSHGPPTVDQGPMFPVPKSGYEVEGRPGLIHAHPHIKTVPWEAFSGPGIPAGLQRRLLSKSPSMGAVTQITYVPAGWSQPEGYHDVDNEIMVLDGDLTIGEGADADKLTKYSYSFMPAGVKHGPVKSRQGAVLIQWWKGEPNFVASRRDKKGARPYARVRDWNHYKGSWYIDKPFPDYRAGGNFPGYLHKMLREDPDTREMTWMTFVSSLPAAPTEALGNFGGGFEVHPSFEEYFLPEGSRYSDDPVSIRTPSKYGGECLEEGLTRLNTGTRGYFWRAGGVGHGGTRAPGPLVDNVSYGGKAGWGWTLVRTGTALWATYVTDCTYKTGIEYTGSEWLNYDYELRRKGQK